MVGDAMRCAVTSPQKGCATPSVKPPADSPVTSHSFGGGLRWWSKMVRQGNQSGEDSETAPDRRQEHKGSGTDVCRARGAKFFAQHPHAIIVPSRGSRPPQIVAIVHKLRISIR